MRLDFVVSESLRGLYRNIAMVISVVIVTAVSLTFVGTGLLMQRQIDVLQAELTRESQVTVFMCSTYSSAPSCAGGPATEAQISRVADELAGPGLEDYVADVEQRSQQQAWSSYMAEFGDEPFAQGTEPTDLPVSFRITLTDPTRSAVVADTFTGRDGVDEVRDLIGVYEPMMNVLGQASLAALVFAGFMLVAAVLLVFTTIRMSAVNRRREISIMRLVGASNLFIRAPFILEGVVSAVIGAGIAGALLWAGVRWGVTDYVAARIGTQLPLIQTPDVYTVLPALLVLGVLLAGLSSVISLNRYLKV